jgi:hypothetical protein
VEDPTISVTDEISGKLVGGSHDDFDFMIETLRVA